MNINSYYAYLNLPKFTSNHRLIIFKAMERLNKPCDFKQLTHVCYLSFEQIHKRLSEMQRLGYIKYHNTVNNVSTYRIRLENEPFDICTPKQSKAVTELFTLKESYDKLLTNNHNLKIKILALTNRVNYLENNVIEKCKQTKLNF